MFNLEQAITEWRQRMLAAGLRSPVPLDELESHLRDEIERQVRAGAPAAAQRDRVAMSASVRRRSSRKCGVLGSQGGMARLAVIVAIDCARLEASW